LHAGEVATVSLRSEAAAPLEVIGLLPDGRNCHLTVNNTLAGSEAVKLLWARERIATLLDTGRQTEAIAMARQYNLVCKGAAFIAWDEAEQVAIARETLVQPALEQAIALRQRCAAAPAASPAPGQGSFTAGFSEKCRSYSGNADRGLIMKETTSNLLDRLRRWAASSRKNSGNMAETTRTMIETIGRGIASPKVRQTLELRFQNALASPAGDEIWIRGFVRLVSRIGTLEKRLVKTGAPTALIDHLLEWLLIVTGNSDQERFQALENFLAALDTSAFSAAGNALLWRTFLEKNLGSNSEAFAAAAVWLPAIRDPLLNPPTSAPV
jgi:hypothetical protein